MQILKFHTTQTDLANTIKSVVDSYLENEISHEEMIESLNELVHLNSGIYYKNEDKEIVNTKVKAVLGVKRLSLIDNVLRQRKVKE